MKNCYGNINGILYAFCHGILLISMTSAFPNKPTFGNESDFFALLDFKIGLHKDPFKVMNSWNDSMHFCNWVGVTCNNNTPRRVVILNLDSQKLSGSLPPSLGNLTYLTELHLGNNHFNGRIPLEFGQLLRLHHLNLSVNNLGEEIPANISRCTELIFLSIRFNELEGKIPDQFSTLTKLDRLGFGGNNLTGTIPSWIGNFSSMLRLSLDENNFQGSIPTELGRLSKLQLFDVFGNNLTGTVPSSIYNITSLNILSLTQNQLQGILPPDIGFTLPNLQIFAVGANNFRGPIPASLANASGLQILEFYESGFTGMIPDLGSSKDLWTINFGVNRLGSGKIGDLNFINSLANCTSLTELILFDNHFGGELPPSIANLSNQLTFLSLGRNMLSGSIPTGIENLVNLQLLGMERNHFSGSVPHIIGKLQNLNILDLSRNQFTETIPSSIGNLSSLAKLFMEDNRLEGSIPPSLGQCKRLLLLGLSGNSLNGTIPKEVIGLSSLSIYLNLNHNSLTGPLPYEVGELFSLAMLDVSENKLSGHIPSSLGKCNSMEQLRLGGNKFEGTIPESLEALKGLEELNLSSNNFSGQIPKFLSKLHALKHLDMSYNNFEGEVPKEGIFSNATMFSIFGNKNLCGGLQELHLPPCPATSTKKSLALKILIPIISAVAFLVILVSILYACFKGNKSRRRSLTSSSSSKDLLPQISYLELSKSTNGFSADNLIGSGSFGCVYKGILSGDGSTVAIKVLNLQQHGASKSFISECKALAIIRHRNLVKIISSCSSIDEQANEFKALIFDFMSNGNLDRWFHTANDVQNQSNSSRLSFIQRLNIAIDIANALDYLHNQCETPIVHCDLKPSNVLLDNDMVAHVGDFGLARIILEESNESSFEQTLSLALKGSIGYIPPEYGSGGIVSIKGDIYSYGILVLEMITGKRPTDDSFGDDSDIRQFITAAMPDHILDIVDPSLFFTEFDRQNEETQEMAIMVHRDRREMEEKKMEECLVLIIGIGISCSSTSPGERMSMDVVVNELKGIRDSFLKLKNAKRIRYRNAATD